MSSARSQSVLAGDVLQALARERLVDVLAVLGIRVQALLAFGLCALARRADVHHREPCLLGKRKGACVEGVG
jgi:hypothetical protein